MKVLIKFVGIYKSILGDVSKLLMVLSVILSDTMAALIQAKEVLNTEKYAEMKAQFSVAIGHAMETVILFQRAFLALFKHPDLKTDFAELYELGKSIETVLGADRLEAMFAESIAAVSEYGAEMSGANNAIRNAFPHHWELLVNPKQYRIVSNDDFMGIIGTEGGYSAWALSRVLEKSGFCKDHTHKIITFSVVPATTATTAAEI